MSRFNASKPFPAEPVKTFVERGLVSAAAARKTGTYVPAATVLGKLVRRLAKTRKGQVGSPT